MLGWLTSIDWERRGLPEWRLSSSHEEPGDVTVLSFRRSHLKLFFLGHMQKLFVWWPQGQPGAKSKINRKKRPRKNLGKL
jgi:hypothetical protein